MNSIVKSIKEGDENKLRSVLNQRDAQTKIDMDNALCVLTCNQSQNNTEDAHSVAPLALEDRVKFANILLDFGADPNATYRGIPLLIYAILNNDFQMAESILNKGCDPNAGNPSCENDPVRCALKLLNKKILRLLLEKGANPDRQDENGYTPFATLCHTGFVNYRSSPDPDVVDLFLKYADLNIADNHGKTPLFHAVADCTNDEDFQTSMTLKIIRSGRADTNSADQSGTTPLMIAASKRSAIIAKALLESGCSVNVQNQEGKTPLHFAAKQRNTRSLIDLLVQAGSDMNAHENQPPPLYVAAKEMNADNVLCLLEHNAYVPTTFEVYDLKRLHMIDCGAQVMALLIYAGHNWDFTPLSYKFPRRFAICGGSGTPNFEEILHGDILENYRQRVDFANRMTRPILLKDLCRWQIRKILGSNLKEKLDTLISLPRALKECLFLPELQWVFEVFES